MGKERSSGCSLFADSTIPAILASKKGSEGGNMRKPKGLFMLFTLVLFLSGCSETAKQSSQKITIEPYVLSDRENTLVTQTGVDQIDYFKLNGTVAEEEKLLLSIESFKNGRSAGEVMITEVDSKTTLKDHLISFGISNFSFEDERFFELKIGTPISRSSATYENKMVASSASNLLDEKMNIERNKPVYLALWRGASGTGSEHAFHALDSKPGELPANLDKAELAFLYKILWTKKDE